MEQALVDQLRIISETILRRQIVHMPSLPSTPDSKASARWYSEAIQWATEGMDTTEINVQVSSPCRRGCSACCRQAIMIMGIEKGCIVTKIKMLDKKTQSKIKLRTDEICKKLNSAGIYKKNLQEYILNENQFRDKYFSFNMECPLLSDKKECLIYDVRPTACWSYKCYGIDSLECEVSASPDMSYQYSNYEAQVIDCLIDLKGLSIGMELLPFALKSML